MWMTSCTGSVRGGFWEIWEKSVSWVLARRKKVDFRSLAEALWQVPHLMGVDGKVSIEILCLTPYVEKPFNSKVIKSFVPELRSRQCFSCFGIPTLCIYVIYEHYECFTYRHEYIYFTHIHISGCIFGPGNVTERILMNSMDRKNIQKN